MSSKIVFSGIVGIIDLTHHTVRHEAGRDSTFWGVGQGNLQN